MSIATKAETGCILVGEFVDEGVIPPGTVSHRGEPVRTTSTTEFIDHWTTDAAMKEFTVLLHGGRVVSVRGHELKHLPGSGSGDKDSYGIIVRAAAREELIAVFKASDVDGIFHGEMRVDRTVA